MLAFMFDYKTVLLLCVMNVLRTIRFLYAGVPACQLQSARYLSSPCLSVSRNINKCIFIPRILR